MYSDSFYKQCYISTAHLGECMPYIKQIWLETSVKIIGMFTRRDSLKGQLTGVKSFCTDVCYVKQVYMFMIQIKTTNLRKCKGKKLNRNF